MMRKIAGESRRRRRPPPCPGGLQAVEQMNIAVRLRVVFTSGQQGAAAEWNSEDVIGAFRDIGGRPVTKHSVP